VLIGAASVAKMYGKKHVYVMAGWKTQKEVFATDGARIHTD